MLHNRSIYPMMPELKDHMHTPCINANDNGTFSCDFSGGSDDFWYYGDDVP